MYRKLWKKYRFNLFVTALLIVLVSSLVALIEPGENSQASSFQDDDSGLFEVVFDSSSGIAAEGVPLRENIVVQDGVATIADGFTTGYFTTDAIEPTSTNGYTDLIIEARNVVSESALQARVVDCTLPTPNEILPAQNVSSSNPISLASINPEINSCIKIETTLTETSSITPEITRLSVAWTPRSYLNVAIDCDEQVRSGDEYLCLVRYSASLVKAQDVVIYSQLPDEAGGSITGRNPAYNQNVDPDFVSASDGGRKTDSEITVHGITIPANSVYWDLGDIDSGVSSTLVYRQRIPIGTQNGITYSALAQGKGSNTNESFSDDDPSTPTRDATTTNSLASSRIEVEREVYGAIEFNEDKYVFHPPTGVSTEFTPTITHSITVKDATTGTSGVENLWNPVVTEDLTDIFNILINECGVADIAEAQSRVIADNGGSFTNSELIWTRSNHLIPNGFFSLNYTIDYTGCKNSEQTFSSTVLATGDNLPDGVSATEQVLQDAEVTGQGGFGFGDEIRGRREVTPNQDNADKHVNYEEPFAALHVVQNNDIVHLEDFISVQSIPAEVEFISAIIDDDEVQGDIYYSTNDLSDEPEFYNAGIEYYGMGPDWTNTLPSDRSTVNWVGFHIPCLSSRYFEDNGDYLCPEGISQAVGEVYVKAKTPVDVCSEFTVNMEANSQVLSFPNRVFLGNAGSGEDERSVLNWYSGIYKLYQSDEFLTGVQDTISSRQTGTQNTVITITNNGDEVAENVYMMFQFNSVAPDPNSRVTISDPNGEYDEYDSGFGKAIGEVRIPTLNPGSSVDITVDYRNGEYGGTGGFSPTPFVTFAVKFEDPDLGNTTSPLAEITDTAWGPEVASSTLTPLTTGTGSEVVQGGSSDVFQPTSQRYGEILLRTPAQEWVNVKSPIANVGESYVDGDAVVLTGEEANYQIIAKNTGDDTSLGTIVTIEKPVISINGVATKLEPIVISSGVTTDYTSDPDRITVAIGSLDVGEEKTVRVQVDTPRGILNSETLSLRTLITGTDDNGCAGIITNTGRSTRIQGTSNLTIAKDVDLSVTGSGAEINYFASARSTGLSPTTGTYIVERIPTESRLVEAYTAGTIDNTDLTCPGCTVFFGEARAELPPNISPTQPLDKEDIETYFVSGIETSPGVWSPPASLTAPIYIAFNLDNPTLSPAQLPNNGLRDVGYKVINDADGYGSGTVGSLPGTILRSQSGLLSDQLLQTTSNQVRTIILPDPGLRLNKYSSKEYVSVEEVFDWTVEYYNDSSNSDSEVIITDTLPENLEILGIWHTWNDTALANGLPSGEVQIHDGVNSLSPHLTQNTTDAGLVELVLQITSESGGDLRGGELLTLEGGSIRIQARPTNAAQSGDLLLNHVEGCYANAAGGYCLTDQDSVWVENPDLEIQKSTSLINPVAGDRVVYTLRGQNYGRKEAINTTISDTLPLGLCYEGPNTVFSPWTLGGNSNLTNEPTITYENTDCTDGETTLSWDAPGDNQIQKPDYSAGYFPGCLEGADCIPVTITYPVRVDSAVLPDTTLTNTARIANDLIEDPNYANEAQVDVRTPFADPYVLKEGPQTVVPGGTLTYTLTYGNNTRQSTSDVYLIDTLPDVSEPGVNGGLPDGIVDFTFISSSTTGGETLYYHDALTTSSPGFDPLNPAAGGWTVDPDTLTNPVSHVAVLIGGLAGEATSGEITIIMQANSPITGQKSPIGQTFINRATIFSGAADEDTGNNEASVVTVTPGLDLSVDLKLAAQEQIAAVYQPGDDINYLVEYINSGTERACGVYLEGLLPAGLAYQETVSNLGIITVLDETGNALDLVDPAEAVINTDVIATLTRVSDTEIRIELGSNETTPYTDTCIPVGGRATFLLYATATTEVEDSTTYRHTVTIGEDSPDNELVLTNNEAGQDILIFLSDVLIDSQVETCTDETCATINSGDNTIDEANGHAQYTITYDNIGNNEARNVAITQDIAPDVCYQVGSLEDSLQGRISSDLLRIDYSDNGESSYSYIPRADASGVDCEVTHYRITFNSPLRSPAREIGEQDSFAGTKTEVTTVDGDLELTKGFDNEFDRQFFLQSDAPLAVFNDPIYTDIDGDGDTDMIGDRIYENTINENGSFDIRSYYTGEDQPIIYSPIRAVYTLEELDFEGDGDADFVVSHNDIGRPELYINDGAGNFRANAISIAFLATSSGGGSPYYSGLGRGQGIQVIDIDGDGDDEVVTGTVDSSWGDTLRIHYADNSGEMAYHDYRIFSQTDRLFLDEAVTSIADLDNDGDLDIVTNHRWENSTGGGNLSVFYNNGDQNENLDFTRELVETAVEISSKAYSYSVEIADIDQDGWNDIVLASFEEVEILINQQDGTFINFTTSVDDTERIEIANFDADPELEILALSADRDFESYLVDFIPAGGFATANAISSSEGVFDTGAEVFDIEGDGDLDFVAWNQGTTGATDYVFAYNDGSGNFTVERHDAHNRISGQRLFEATNFVDIDNDGDLDTVHYDMYVYINNGNGTHTRIATGSLRQYAHPYLNEYGGNPQFIDIDGDGDLDIFYGLFMFTNNGSSFAIEEIPNVTNHRRYTPTTVYDYDGDGYSDIIRMDEYSNINYYGGSSTGLDLGSFIFSGHNNAQYTLVFDNNTIFHPDRGLIKTFNGSGFDTIDIHKDFGFSLRFGNHRYVHPFDYNQDGTTDYLVKDLYSDTDVDTIFVDDGDGTFTEIPIGFKTTVGIYGGRENNPDLAVVSYEDHSDYDYINQYDIYDYQNDGDLDFLHIDTVNGNFYRVVNNGDGTFSQLQINTVPLPEYDILDNYYDVSFYDADFDNNGLQDVVFTTHDTVLIYLLQPDGNFIEKVQSMSGTEGTPLGSWGANFAADFNNDGNIDLVHTSLTTSDLMINDGAGNFTVMPFPQISFAQVRFLNIPLEDLNNDGYPDFYWGGKVYINDGSPITDFIVIDLNQSPISYGRDYVDLNGDGITDLVTYGTNNTVPARFYIYDGGTNFTEVYNEYILGTQEWFDFENDGDLDLFHIRYVFGQKGAGIYLHRNDGNGNFVEERILGTLPTTQSLGSVEVLDINKDGFLDAVPGYTGIRYDERDTYPVVFLNNQAGSFESVSLNDLYGIDLEKTAATIPRYTFFTDLDGDGEIELLNPVDGIFYGDIVPQDTEPTYSETGTYTILMDPGETVEYYNKLIVDDEIPSDTLIRYTILASDCATILAGPTSATNGFIDLQSLDPLTHSSLCLQVDMQTNDPSSSPILKSWSLGYESDEPPSYTYNVRVVDDINESPLESTTCAISSSVELETINNCSTAILNADISDLFVEMEVDRTVMSTSDIANEEKITYTITYGNKGPKTAENVQIITEYSNFVSTDFDDVTYTYEDTNLGQDIESYGCGAIFSLLYCGMPTLEPGETGVIIIETELYDGFLSDGDVVPHVVNISSFDSLLTNLSDDTSSVSTLIGDLPDVYTVFAENTTSNSSQLAYLGGNYTTTIDYGNSGSVDALDSLVRIDLDDESSFVSATQIAGSTALQCTHTGGSDIDGTLYGGTVYCSLDGTASGTTTLPATENGSIELSLTITPDIQTIIDGEDLNLTSQILTSSSQSNIFNDIDQLIVPIRLEDLRAISGIVFEDTNTNLSLDEGEGLLSNVTVIPYGQDILGRLYGPNKATHPSEYNQVIADWLSTGLISGAATDYEVTDDYPENYLLTEVTTTNGAGQFAAGGFFPGSYSLLQIQPDNYDSVGASSGEGVVESDNKIGQIDLQAFANSDSNLFAETVDTTPDPEVDVAALFAPVSDPVYPGSTAILNGSCDIVSGTVSTLVDYIAIIPNELILQEVRVNSVLTSYNTMSQQDLTNRQINVDGSSYSNHLIITFQVDISSGCNDLNVEIETIAASTLTPPLTLESCTAIDPLILDTDTSNNLDCEDINITIPPFDIAPTLPTITDEVLPNESVVFAPQCNILQGSLTGSVDYVALIPDELLLTDILVDGSSVTYQTLSQADITNLPLGLNGNNYPEYIFVSFPVQLNNDCLALDIDIQTTVKPDVIAPVDAELCVGIDSNVAETNISNNNTCTSVSIVATPTPQADLEIAVSVDKNLVIQNEEFVYTASYTHLAGDATEASLTLQLEEQVEILEIALNGTVLTETDYIAVPPISQPTSLTPLAVGDILTIPVGTITPQATGQVTVKARSLPNITRELNFSGSIANTLPPSDSGNATALPDFNLSNNTASLVHNQRQYVDITPKLPPDDEEYEEGDEVLITPSCEILAGGVNGTVDFIAFIPKELTVNRVLVAGAEVPYVLLTSSDVDNLPLNIDSSLYADYTVVSFPVDILDTCDTIDIAIETTVNNDPENENPEICVAIDPRIYDPNIDNNVICESITIRIPTPVLPELPELPRSGGGIIVDVLVYTTGLLSLWVLTKLFVKRQQK